MKRWVTAATAVLALFGSAAAAQPTVTPSAKFTPPTFETAEGTWLQCDWQSTSTDTMDSPRFLQTTETENQSVIYKFIGSIGSPFQYDKQRQTIDIVTDVTFDDSFIHMDTKYSYSQQDYVNNFEHSRDIDRRTLELNGLVRSETSSLVDNIRSHTMITGTETGTCKLIDPQPLRAAQF